MKIRVVLLLPLICVLISGCASTAPTKSANRRFHEVSKANAVLQFSSWEYTFLIQPRYDDHGFLLQVPREKVARIMDEMNVRRRDLAVVVLGWSYNPEQVSQLVTDWKMILGGCGFQRVVIVKSTGRKDLDGSLIIDDSNPSGQYADRITQLQPSAAGRPDALVTSATGTDAPHPSGDSIR